LASFGQDLFASGTELCFTSGQDQCLRAIGVLPGKPLRYHAPEGMPDNDRARYAKVIQEAGQFISPYLNGVLISLTREACTAPVIHDHAKVLGERLSLPMPDAGCCTQAVDEGDGRAVALDFVMDVGAVDISQGGLLKKG
jgi:hypothetical protein